MSSSSSDTENNSYRSDDSDWNYIPGPYQVEKSSEMDKNVNSGEAQSSNHESDYEDVGPYANEPVADEDWLTKYRAEKQTYDERLKGLQRRLDGLEDLNKWCKCGNFRIELLNDAKESQCCMEIEECISSLNSEIVLQDVEVPPTCIIKHPGFIQ